MNEAKPTKMVSRNSAVALGIICIVPGASIIGLLAVMNNMNNTIQTDNNQIFSLTSQIYNLNAAINLNDYGVLFNQSVSVQAGQNVLVIPLRENYSGFIEVTIIGANLTSTWIKVSYYVIASNGDYSYRETRNLAGYFNPYYNGYVDIESFPVLQTYDGDITLGNNGTQTTTVWLTIIYSY